MDRGDWPLLQDGGLTKGSMRRLQELPGQTMFCKGVHIRGEQDEHPALSFALIRFVRRNGEGNRRPLRLLCEVWSMPQGTVMNLAWAYPHSTNFDEEHLTCETYRAARDIIEAVYGPRPIPAEVQRFMDEVFHRH